MTDHDPATSIIVTVPKSLAGFRVDKALSELIDGESRATIQRWIKDERATTSGKPLRQRDAVYAEQQIEIDKPAVQPINCESEAMALDIVFEDESLIVINKPAGLVVHPGAGNLNGTLLNGLLYYDSTLELMPRGGIVHRLDKETSGLMVVARTEKARQNLIAQLSERSVKRHYVALIYGQIIAGGTIDAPIGRHHRDRRKMAITPTGKPAITHYRVRERFRNTTLINVQLETGRTHQIRVHMASKRLPLVGDGTYGARLSLPPGASDRVVEQMKGFRRQALHAERLGFIHPEHGEALQWECRMPTDMKTLCVALREDLREHGA